MKKLHWFLPVIVIVASILCFSRSHTDRIDLESALQNTEDGKYSLVVMVDEFVSFQPGASGKRQYYYDKTKGEETIARVKKAVAEAQKRGHNVQFEDMRNGSANQALHPTAHAAFCSIVCPAKPSTRRHLPLPGCG